MIVNDANPYAPPASDTPVPAGRRLARAARVFWMLFLLASAPMALLGWLTWLMLLFLGGVSHGMVPDAHKLFYPTVLSIVWVLSLACGHRCNSGRRSLVPFAANLLPVLLLVTLEMGDTSPNAVYLTYLGLLALLLVAGAGCALANVRLAEQQDGPASRPPES